MLKYLTDWSNMEIADMEFWRGEAYTAYVEYLERTGGFYYEVTSPPRDSNPVTHTFPVFPFSLTEMG